MFPPRACAGLDKATMSEEAPEPEVAAEGSSEPQVSALEKEMNALLATTQGVPRAPHSPTRSPRLRTATPSCPLPAAAAARGTVPCRGTIPTPPRRAAPGVLGGALSAKAAAGKIRRKSKDLEASLDLMAASDAWNMLGALHIRLRLSPPTS